jgi:chaperone modulatory protein CbpM
MTTALSRPFYLSVESFALASGLHPDMVVQWVRLGLIDAVYDLGGKPYLEPSQLARVARIQRLRSSLSINYAALGLVLDLLDRIDTLEAALRGRPDTSGADTRRAEYRRAENRRPENRHPENHGGAKPRWIRTD